MKTEREEIRIETKMFFMSSFLHVFLLKRMNSKAWAICYEIC
jgi:hypothetical protein